MPLVVRDEGAVRTLILENPEKKNALTRAMLQELTDAVRALPAPVRVVVLRGASDGGAFSSGFDISAITPDERARGLDPICEPADAIEQCAVPVLAAIDGPCMGGAVELAMACTMRIAGQGAVFAIPPARLGLIYSGTGLVRFLRALAPSQAQRLFLTGDRIDAGEALRIGLIDVVAPSVEAEVARITGVIADNAPLAVTGMLQGIRRLAARGLDDETQNFFEEARARTVQSADLLEGVAAFVEKRKPRFSGR
jgi:enoyl-CoA hydratase/carnithine racemase